MDLWMNQHLKSPVHHSSSIPKDGSSHEGKSLKSEAVLLDPGLVSERQPEPKIITAAFCSHLMCS